MHDSTIKKTYIGIDIAKKTFVSAIRHEGQKKATTQEWAYETDADIAAFMSTLPPNAHCVMEATGTYSSRLAYALVAQNHAVSVVNPAAVKYFAKMHGVTTKTDASDAKLILRYAEQITVDLRDFCPPAESIDLMRQWRTIVAALETHQQSYRNQLEALRHHARPNAAIIARYEDLILQAETEIQDIRSEITTLVSTDYEESYTLLTSIPHIGPVIATHFINTYATFVPKEGVDMGKAFASFLGVSPINGSSGTSVRIKPHIGRSGAPILRAKMYLSVTGLCTRSKPDNPFRLFYERLVRNGKAKKQAIIAVMHKLVRTAVAVLESKTPYNIDTCK